MSDALLRREERQERSERIDRESLTRREVKHLALELKVVTGLGATIQRGTLWGDNLYPQVVEIEGIICHGTTSIACCTCPLS